MGGSRAGSVLVAWSAAALLVVGVHPAAGATGSKPALQAGLALPSGGSTTLGEGLWVKRYNGPGNGDDVAHAVALSPDGSTVFVTGSSYGSTSTDYATVAYAASTGAKLWVKRYNGPGNDDEFANALGVTPDGSTVFVTGASPGSTTDFDYATLAYRASTGRRLWVKRYNGPGNGDDEASALAVSPDGSTVFVTGASAGSGSDHDYATVAYRASTGKKLWVKRYNGPGNSFDVAHAVGVSPNGSTVFVTGSSDGSKLIPDYATVAYSASTGAKQWVRRYNGPGNDDDSASALAVSPDGSTVFVTGYSPGSTTDYDYATVAYAASTGRRLWVSRYNGPGNFWDFARALGVSPDGSTLFVTGQSYGEFGNDPDYATVAYGASTGTELWVNRYDGPAHGFDDPRALGVSPDGSTVLVTGASPGSIGNYDYATVAYSASAGMELWVKRYNGPGNAFDAGEALGVSPDSSTVFVTGESYGSTSYDYVTVAYRVI